MFLNKTKKNKGFTRTPKILVSGFTLIEIMVSISVFVVILLISSGSILTIFDANRKSQNLRSVMDNLNYTIESMTRTIRFGNTYHCDRGVVPTYLTRDCSSGASSIVLVDSSGSEIIFDLSNGNITKSINGSTSNLTSSDIIITNLKFYVFGSDPYCSAFSGCVTTDTNQPRVIIAVSGYVGSKATTRSTFSLQTTVSERKVDAQ